MQALNLLVFGAPGSGVSTLCKNLSKALNFQYASLRNRCEPPDSGDPISINNQDLAKLQRQLRESKGHIVDGFPCQSDFSTGEMDGIIYLMTPRVQRLQRIRDREVAVQGEKILEEGCKEFKIFNRFMYWVSQFDQAGIDRESKILHQKFLNSISTPILRANGLLNEEDLTQQTIDWINQISKD